MMRWATYGIILGLAGMMLAPSMEARVQETQPAMEVPLVRGLDGGYYEPYSPDLIESVQGGLKIWGLYEGEVNGILDQATMRAIGDFQKAHGLAVSGVPSPQTRKALFVE